MLRVQSDGNPASRSLDDLAVGDATLRLLSWALRRCPSRAVSARLVAPPTSITLMTANDSLVYP